jgi:hypothetical protein
MAALLMSAVVTSAKAANDNVQITMAPKSPIVFTAPTQMLTEGQATAKFIGAPWFEAKFDISNDETSPLTIVEIKMETLDSKNADRVLNTRVLGTDDFGSDPSNSTAIVTVPAQTTMSIMGFVQELSEFGDSTVVPVRLTFEGFYGSAENPLRRFQKTLQFVTQ